MRRWRSISRAATSGSNPCMTLRVSWRGWSRHHHRCKRSLRVARQPGGDEPVLFGDYRLASAAGVHESGEYWPDHGRRRGPRLKDDARTIVALASTLVFTAAVRGFHHRGSRPGRCWLAPRRRSCERSRTALPASIALMRTESGWPARAPIKLAAVIVPVASTPSVRPPPGGALPNRNATMPPFTPAGPR